MARLTADRPPLELPVVACYYSTTDDDRMSLDQSDFALAHEKVLRTDG